MKHVKTPGILRHIAVVAVLMRGLAEHLDEDVELWELTGILHDIDYDLIDGNFNKHGIVAADLLEGHIPDEAIHAISAHNTQIGLQVKSKLGHALIAADALSHVLEEALEGSDIDVATIDVEVLGRKISESGVTTTSGRFISPEIICLSSKKLGLNLEEFLTIGLRSLLEYKYC